MGLKLSNNASGLLALAISDSATSLSLETGHGSRFPALGAGDYFPITVVRASDPSQFEIMRCTARTQDTLTVERAQEGTSALAFDPGDVVELRLTAGTLEEHFPQMEEGDARKLRFSVDPDTQGKPELTVHGENGESTAFALKGELGARDLNAVFEDGLFVQPSDAGALAALNYPAEKAGVLTVKAVAAGVCTQQYFALDGTLYARTATGGSWSQWNQLLVNSMELVASVLGLPDPIVPDTFLQAKADGSGYDGKTPAEVATALGVDGLESRVAAVEAMPPLGWGQTWQDVTEERAWNTTYTNTTGRPIAVYIRTSIIQATVNISLTIDGVTLTGPSFGDTDGHGRSTSIFAIIPPGAEYSATSNRGISQWAELR